MTLINSFTVNRNNEVTLIVIDKEKNSQCAVKWAMDNLLYKGDSICIFLYVQSHNLNSKDVATAAKGGRPPDNDELEHLFLPYRAFCARKGITAKEVVLHDTDASNAVIHYATSNFVDNIVVGSSSRHGLMRKFRYPDVASSLLKSAPETCTVYVVSSKGKAQTTRYPSQPQSPVNDDKKHQPQSPNGDGNNLKKQCHRDLRSYLESDTATPVEINRSELSCDSLTTEVTDENSTSIETVQTTAHGKFSSNVSSILTGESHMPDSFNMKSVSDRSELSLSLSFQSADISENLDNAIAFKSPGKFLSPQPPATTVTTESLDAEIQRLRMELKQSMDMYNTVCKKAREAKGRIEEAKKLERTRLVEVAAVKLQQMKLEESRKLEEARLAEQATFDMVEIGEQNSRAARKAVQTTQYLTDLKTQKRKITEMNDMYEAEEKRRAREALPQKNIQYKKYTIEQIETATNYFSPSQKIGEGAYGPVYRAIIDHKAVAIKVLRPDISQGLKQFQQEIEVLGSMTHPNIIILLGACHEYGCLVYEHMENGSLEDRLFQKGDTPSIPWSTRFNIAVEIATGLLFLHQNKPEPLVHRDLKPANILLDRNYTSKICDVGLARLVPQSTADSFTQYYMTEAAGTFCYIDPEYQQTGMLGVKSDLYSLGVMLLQIITAKPPMGLTHQVEKAIENKTISRILDPTVSDWPVEGALSFAKLALQCCELRKRDRPDLATVVLPELIRLRDLELETEASYGDLTVPSSPIYSVLPEIAKANQEGMRNNPNVEIEIQRRSISERDGNC
ncbi:U-box domain-containing protein 35-like [Pistacia vera]|uniref:U-box domain-containing protein 35-like n=1 Tax=Pistacia vera TaxID=55513 RepID=UPI001263055F|nr:U-box domain-containing protein 35-like [Pistacia vera]